MEELELVAPADFHTHLRQGELMHLVAPHVAEGGMTLAYVMPNLNPPVTSTALAIDYHARLTPLMPRVHLMMTLFLSPSLTPHEIRRAKDSGVVAGVKSYPRGVTTGSDGGVESYEQYHEVFAEMEKLGLVLNLHGEVPSNATADVGVYNAEAQFLQHLVWLHRRFPGLRIVLEHATTKAAVDCVKSLGETVACTITPHHLLLTLDDVVGQPLNFCKPIAKAYSDRRALREVVASGHSRFFLGSDSAPHPLGSKLPALPSSGGPVPPCAAGIYTSPVLLPLVATLFELPGLEPRIPLERLSDFVGGYGRRWYGVTDERRVKIRRVPHEAMTVRRLYQRGADTIIPFMAGAPLAWRIVADENAIAE